MRLYVLAYSVIVFFLASSCFLGTKSTLSESDGSFLKINGEEVSIANGVQLNEAQKQAIINEGKYKLVISDPEMKNKCGVNKKSGNIENQSFNIGFYTKEKKSDCIDYLKNKKDPLKISLQIFSRNDDNIVFLETQTATVTVSDDSKISLNFELKKSKSLKEIISSKLISGTLSYSNAGFSLNVENVVCCLYDDKTYIHTGDKLTYETKKNKAVTLNFLQVCDGSCDGKTPTESVQEESFQTVNKECINGAVVPSRHIALEYIEKGVTKHCDIQITGISSDMGNMINGLGQ